MEKKVLIIGGGAAGMMSAISAARNNHEVILFEKNEELGKKILITGNGRCNLTNKNLTWENYHGSFPKFASSVISQFDNEKTIQFFEELGLVLVEEDQGRLFPRSQQAQSVVDVLKQELEQLGIQILTRKKIRRVEKIEQQFCITTYQKKKHFGDALIIATGGRTYPKTGSTGDGYRFAESLGHKIIKPFPVSTPFRIKSVVCNKLQGIKIIARLKVYQGEKIISDNTDELLFTHIGLSAPVVLKSSREVSKVLCLNPEAELKCSINFFPEYSQEDLYKLLKKRLVNNPDRNIGNQFLGMLPKKVAPAILRYSRINPEIKSKQLANRTLDRIIKIIMNYELPIDDVLGWDMAQFTAGGVDVREIDSKTMESKLVPNLHFCGEVVDIDGDSGGYNLQWAWSSGFVAGSSI
ncbi:NAD(P)/FAD-dependent oxidoreductase [Candidatus Dojkabacteria bacterium]|nr:NAD(P)/FAD-dependent oxidoreductase [Candidatus Dojkabacteria bacterium]